MDVEQSSDIYVWMTINHPFSDKCQGSNPSHENETPLRHTESEHRGHWTHDDYSRQELVMFTQCLCYGLYTCAEISKGHTERHMSLSIHIGDGHRPLSVSCQRLLKVGSAFTESCRQSHNITHKFPHLLQNRLCASPHCRLPNSDWVLFASGTRPMDVTLRRFEGKNHIFL